MDAAAGMLVQGSPIYNIKKKSSSALKLRVSVSYLTVSSAGFNISAIMRLRKSSYVPPRGVTVTSIEGQTEVEKLGAVTMTSHFW